MTVWRVYESFESYSVCNQGDVELGHANTYPTTKSLELRATRFRFLVVATAGFDFAFADVVDNEAASESAEENK